MNIKMSWFRRFLENSPSAPGYILVGFAVLVNIIIQGGGFFSKWNFSSLFNTATPLILVSMAQMTVILSGGVDLSVGANIAFVNAVAITTANSLGLPLPLSWCIALVAGTAVGFFNGVIVAYVRLPPFLSTFASMTIIQGLALLVLPSPGGSVPKEVYSRYGGFTLGLPTPFYILLFAIVLWILVFKTPLGRHIRAVGGNPRNAYVSGISVERTRLAAFTIGGFFTACAGISLTAYMGAGDPLIGGPYTLKSLATVILGGTMFDSGWGQIGGTVSGSFFFVIVSNIVFFAFNRMQNLFPGFNISTFYQDLLTNLIIILGLVSSVFFKRRRVSTPVSGEGDKS